MDLEVEHGLLASVDAGALLGRHERERQLGGQPVDLDAGAVGQHGHLDGDAVLLLDLLDLAGHAPAALELAREVARALDLEGVGAEVGGARVAGHREVAPLREAVRVGALARRDLDHGLGRVGLAVELAVLGVEGQHVVRERVRGDPQGARLVGDVVGVARQAGRRDRVLAHVAQALVRHVVRELAGEVRLALGPHEALVGDARVGRFVAEGDLGVVRLDGERGLVHLDRELAGERHRHVVGGLHEVVHLLLAHLDAADALVERVGGAPGRRRVGLLGVSVGDGEVDVVGRQRHAGVVDRAVLLLERHVGLDVHAVALRVIGRLVALGGDGQARGQDLVGGALRLDLVVGRVLAEGHVDRVLAHGGLARDLGRVGRRGGRGAEGHVERGVARDRSALGLVGQLARLLAVDGRLRLGLDSDLGGGDGEARVVRGRGLERRAVGGVGDGRPHVVQAGG